MTAILTTMSQPPAQRTGLPSTVKVLLVFAVVTGLVAGLVTGAVWTWRRGFVLTAVVRPHCSVTGEGASVELKPEQAGNAATIASIAVHRGLPARAASIGIATAMQESKLHNIGYGDRDSVGLFQQRPSQGWGTRRQIMDPVYSTNAFYDVLVKIEGFQNLTITEAAQQVQRSAFPSAYANHEPEARRLASAFAGYSPAALTCVLDPPAEGLRAQQPDGSGLTPRARAVAVAARRETGHRTTQAATPNGTGVRFQVAGEEAGRRGWSLAQWAVARADGLDVVEVSTDGRRWRRDAPGSGWARQESSPTSRGSVVVRVEQGD